MLNDFTLALELMSSAIKSDTSINGMKIDNSEYLLSQYADDSSFILDGGDDSFRKSLYILEKISECAGLKTNLEKTEAIWIGSKVHSKERLLIRKKIKWNQSGRFKLLGINYDLFTEDKTAINLKQKVEKNKNIVKFMDLLGSGLYGKNYSNEIISNANLNPISQCFAHHFR